MAKDFAKRSKPRKKTPPPSRFSLGSYMAGVITGVGLFLLGAYGPEMLGIDDTAGTTDRLASTPQTPGAGGQTKTENQAKSGDAPATGTDDTAEEDLTFEFRDLLGTDRVEPDVSAYETGIDSSQRPVPRPGLLSSTPQAPMRYLLQSGSFQIKADAESRRGSLLLLNMPANIVEAQLENKIWYRVIVGPYTERSKAQQAAIRMRAEKIDSIWMEQPINAG